MSSAAVDQVNHGHDAAAAAATSALYRVQAMSEQLGMNAHEERAPVAENYMYDFQYNHPLPTTNRLGVEIPQDCDAQKESESIVNNLSNALAAANAEAFADLFLEYGVWRDKLSFTWDYRTFNFRPAILTAAADLLRHLGSAWTVQRWAGRL